MIFSAAMLPLFIQSYLHRSPARGFAQQPKPSIAEALDTSLKLYQGTFAPIEVSLRSYVQGKESLAITFQRQARSF
jgi:hypothetical protein